MLGITGLHSPDETMRGGAVEALAAMALGLAVGWISGTALRSRCAMLLAPVVFLVVSEVVSIGATGPTVDAPNPGGDAEPVGRGCEEAPS